VRKLVTTIMVLSMHGSTMKLSLPEVALQNWKNTTEEFNQDSRCPSADSISGPPKCKYHYRLG